MRIPKKLKLGPLIYTIETVERLMDENKRVKLSGQISPSKCIIYMEEGNDIQMQALTLFHEMIHHIILMNGQESAVEPDRMEDLTEAIASGMMSAMKDNPMLLRMIEELP